MWVFDAQTIPNIGLNAVAGRPKEEYGVNPTAFDEMRGAETDEPPLFDLNAGMDPQQQTWTKDAFAPATNDNVAPSATAQGMSADVSMEDAIFDDLNFDSVFDFDSVVDDGQGTGIQ